MADQVFIYWDDWKEQIVKKEILNYESLRFSKKDSKEEKPPKVLR